MSNEPNETKKQSDDDVVYVPFEDIYTIERAINNMERAREEFRKAAEEITETHHDNESDKDDKDD